MLERFSDPLSEVTDEDIARLHTEEPLAFASEPPSQCIDYGMFQYEQYDWTAAGFTADYQVIKLTQGYFSVVAPEDYARIANSKWHANVQLDGRTGDIKRIYAMRTFGPKGNRQCTSMHREVMQANPGDIVDHRRRCCLDNRWYMLRRTDISSNGRNTPDRKRVHNLPRGVEYAFGTRKYVRGVIWVLDPDGVTRRKRSPERYPANEVGIALARTWHLDESHRRGLLDDEPPPMPVFPPLKRKTFIMPKPIFGLGNDSEHIPF